MLFAYTAKLPTGVLTQGTIESSDMRTAMAKLRGRWSRGRMRGRAGVIIHQRDTPSLRSRVAGRRGGTPLPQRVLLKDASLARPIHEQRGQNSQLPNTNSQLDPSRLSPPFSVGSWELAVWELLRRQQVRSFPLLANYPG